MLRTAARLIGALALPFLGFALASVALITVAGLADLYPPLPPPLMPPYMAAILGLPLIVTAAIAYRVRSWIPDVLLKSKGLRAAIVVSYLATAFLGVPAVQTESNDWAVAEYKSLVAEPDHNWVWEGHPYIATYAAIPILPCLIVTYDEYQLANLYGLGSFRLTLWYGSGVKTVGRLPLWIS